jgi:S1-C subfamily serine protease
MDSRERNLAPEGQEPEMHRRFSLAFVVVIAIIALTFGTLAGGIAGGIAALVLSPDSQPVETVAEEVVTPTPTPIPLPSPAPPSAETGETVQADQASRSIADIVEEVSPAVVTVQNNQRLEGITGQSDEPERAGVGSGFFIDEDGHIITNQHVVRDSDSITVLLHDGSEVEATLIGSDQFADIAVIKIDGPVPGVLRFGDSDAARPGEQVIAIGSALGDYTNTVTEGIVSAKGRNLQLRTGFNLENMIQHSASINPGNSGGPLLNLNGEVVGVNTAVVRGSGLGIAVEGLGFAIPSNTVQVIAVELMEQGQLERPFIGIMYLPLSQTEVQAMELPVEGGVIVQQVEPDTPAAEAGLQEGDIITKINGEQITSQNPLINLLFNFRVGDTIDLEVYRPSEETTLTLQLTLAARPN